MFSKKIIAYTALFSMVCDPVFSVHCVRATESMDWLDGEITANNFQTSSFVHEDRRHMYVQASPSTTLPSYVDLLSGSNGFRVQSSDDGTGGSTAPAEDFNGDGIADFVAGAPLSNNNAGRVWVVFGKHGGFSTSINPSSLVGTAGFILSGSANDLAGTSVAGGKDINGDGLPDIVIGAPGSSTPPLRGKAYVVFGSRNPFSSLTLSMLNGENGFGVIDGTARTGENVGLGDVNGDGLADVLIGSQAGVTVIFGSRGAFNPTFSVNDLTGGNGFFMQADTASAANGYVPAGVGDFNGDSLHDVIVGAQNYNANTGRAYILFGNNVTTFPPAFNLSSIATSGGVALNGFAAGDLTGAAVSGGGDVNKDGFADVVIGAPGFSSSTGIAYVLFGNRTFVSGSTQSLLTLNGRNGFSIAGIRIGDRAGASVGLSDSYTDGYSDVLVGAPSAACSYVSSGHTYLIYGSPAKFPSQIGLSNPGEYGVSFGYSYCANGYGGGVNLGASIAGIGDINDDGYPDVACGTFSASDSSEYVGDFAVFGIPAIAPTPAPTLAPAPSSLPSTTFPSYLDKLTGSNGFQVQNSRDGTGDSTAPAGDFNGDGIADFVTGAPLANSNAGRVWVVFGKHGGFSTSINPSSLVGTAGFILSGSANDLAGTSVAGGKDINGDGLPDIVIGAPGSSTPPLRGKAYVVFGSRNPFSSLTLSMLNGENGFGVIDGTARTGENVGLGDVNGDGLADVLIGSQAGVTVIFGSRGAFNPTFSVNDLTGGNGFFMQADTASAANGYVPAGVGDFNGDSLHDVIVGAQNYNANTGRAYILFGNNVTTFPPAFNLSSIATSGGVALNGFAAGDLTGAAVSGGGDVNKDGFADVVIGAPGFSSSTGIAYVLFGNRTFVSGSTQSLLTLNGRNGFSIAGIRIGDRAGASVGLSDSYTDGYSDVLVGAPSAACSYVSSGHTYLIYGSPAKFPSQIGLSNPGEYGVSFGYSYCANGYGGGVNLGASIAGIGDINDDGYPDVACGTFSASDSSEYVGDFAVFGIPAIVPTLTPTLATTTLSASEEMSLSATLSVTETATQTLSGSISASHTSTLSTSKTATQTLSDSASSTIIQTAASSSDITPLIIGLTVGGILVVSISAFGIYKCVKKEKRTTINKDHDDRLLGVALKDINL